MFKKKSEVKDYVGGVEDMVSTLLKLQETMSVISDKDKEKFSKFEELLATLKKEITDLPETLLSTLSTEMGSVLSEHSSLLSRIITKVESLETTMIEVFKEVSSMKELLGHLKDDISHFSEDFKRYLSVLSIIEEETKKHSSAFTSLDSRLTRIEHVLSEIKAVATHEAKKTRREFSGDSYLLPIE